MHSSAHKQSLAESRAALSTLREIIASAIAEFQAQALCEATALAQVTTELEETICRVLCDSPMSKSPVVLLLAAAVEAESFSQRLQARVAEAIGDSR